MNKYCAPGAHSCAAEFYAPLAVYGDNYDRLMTLLPALRQVTIKNRLEFAVAMVLISSCLRKPLIPVWFA